LVPADFPADDCQLNHYYSICYSTGTLSGCSIFSRLLYKLLTLDGGSISQIPRHLRAGVLITVTLPAILWLTLRSDPHAASVVDLTPWWCVSCGPAGTADQLQNLLLFLPLGVAAGWAGWTLRVTGAVLLGLTVMIESLQAFLGNGRDAALGDVLANALGGLLGWWLVQLGGRRWLAVQHAAAPIGVGLFVAQLIATASLNGPTVSGPEPWQLRLRPETVDRPTYRGAIIAIELGGRSIVMEAAKPLQPADPSAPIVIAEITWDDIDESTLTPIVRLDDARNWSIFAIDRRAQHLGVSVRTRAGQLRLRTPTWLVAVPDDTRSGDTLTVWLSVQGGSATVAARRSDGTARSTRFAYGAQHGWAFINPFARAHPSVATWQRWTLAWLFGWGVLLGLTTMPARRPTAWLGAALVGLIVLTGVAGALASPWEVLALLVGWGLAAVTGSWFRRAPIEA
jgi:hypothetical protein